MEVLTRQADDELPETIQQALNHTASPSRYNPYSRNSSVLPDRASQKPRLMPSHKRTPQASPRSNSASLRSESPGRTSKAYGTTKVTSRYQPSRGAQRDAKWRARYQERTHLQSQQHPQDPSWAGRTQHQSLAQKYETPHNDETTLTYPGRGQMRLPNLEKVRLEQQIAIANARKVLAARLKQGATKEETIRNTRRIQLQVFVHAR
jgi:hypothetical protein